MNAKKLARAIEAKDYAEVTSALKDRKNIKGPIAGGDWLIHLAVRTGDLHLVEMVLDAGSPLEPKDGIEDTPLHNAVRGGFPELVRLLLKHGADPYAKDDNFCDTMTIAIQLGNSKGDEIIRVLVEHGFVLGPQGAGYTPLMFSIVTGRHDLVDWFLNSGSNIDESTNCGTPLHVAVERNQLPVVRLLLQRGANPTVRMPADADYPGLTPLELAKKLKHKAIVAVLEESSLKTAPKADIRWPDYASAVRVKFPSKELFAAPAPDEDVARLSAVCDTPLPPDFAEYLDNANGQSPKTRGLIAPPLSKMDTRYGFMSVKKMLRAIEEMTKLQQDEQFKDMVPSAGPVIRRVWWSEGWLPFATNGNGDYICLDLSPTKKGKAGQVIFVPHEGNVRTLLAESFAVWLSEQASSL